MDGSESGEWAEILDPHLPSFVSPMPGLEMSGAEGGGDSSSSWGLETRSRREEILAGRSEEKPGLPRDEIGWGEANEVVHAARTGGEMAGVRGGCRTGGEGAEGEELEVGDPLLRPGRRTQREAARLHASLHLSSRSSSRSADGAEFVGGDEGLKMEVEPDGGLGAEGLVREEPRHWQ